MARAASGPGRPGPSTQCRRPQEGFRARPGLRVLGLRRAAARSAGAYRTGWSRAPGTAVRVPEADPRQVPGLRVPGPGSFLSAGPVLPTPSSPQRPGGTWEVSDVDSAYTEHPLCAQPSPGSARGLLPFVQPGWRCAQPGVGMILSALQTCGVVTVTVTILYKRKAGGPAKLTCGESRREKCGKTVLTARSMAGIRKADRYTSSHMVEQKEVVATWWKRSSNAGAEQTLCLLPGQVFCALVS